MKIRSIYGEYHLNFDEKIDYAGIIKEGDLAIIDRYVYKCHERKLKPFFSSKNTILINATEEQKSYQGIEPIIREIIERGFHKNNKLIAIGGGITQDVTAFIASVLYRGVSWLLVPTTLLAQCDSCIGSKTSINFDVFKNQIGGFYPPKQILIDTGFLKTLSDKEIKSGLGEMLHYYVVGGEKDILFFEENYKKSKFDDSIMRKLIERSLQIKKEYIEKDEFDKNERQIFNYGHSFGHAIESITNYKIPHGIAVSYGMDIANYISYRMGLLSVESRDMIRCISEYFWTKDELKCVNCKELLNMLSKDKKNIGKKLGIILCSGFGNLHKEMIDPNGIFESYLCEYLERELY